MITQTTFRGSTHTRKAPESSSGLRVRPLLSLCSLRPLPAGEIIVYIKRSVCLSFLRLVIGEREGERRRERDRGKEGGRQREGGIEREGGRQGRRDRKRRRGDRRRWRETEGRSEIKSGKEG